MDKRVALYIFVQDGLACCPVTDDDVRNHTDLIIVGRQNVRTQITQTRAAVTGDDAANDDVALVICEMIGPIVLDPFAQCERDSIAQARLEGLVIERQNLD